MHQDVAAFSILSFAGCSRYGDKCYVYFPVHMIDISVANNCEGALSQATKHRYREQRAVEIHEEALKLAMDGEYDKAASLFRFRKPICELFTSY